MTKYKELQERKEKEKHLSLKEEQYESLSKEENEKWVTYIEHKIREEAEQAKRGLDSQSTQLSHSCEQMKQLEKQITSQQEDLEVLSLEKVVQQDEYNSTTTEWKRKQVEVLEQNKQLLALNEEYNSLRQQYVFFQQEISKRRDVIMVDSSKRVIGRGKRENGSRGNCPQCQNLKQQLNK